MAVAAAYDSDNSDDCGFISLSEALKRKHAASNVSTDLSESSSDFDHTDILQATPFITPRKLPLNDEVQTVKKRLRTGTPKTPNGARTPQTCIKLRQYDTEGGDNIILQGIELACKLGHSPFSDKPWLELCRLKGVDKPKGLKRRFESLYSRWEKGAHDTIIPDYIDDLRAHSKLSKPRQMFTKEEDLKILKYFQDNPPVNHECYKKFLAISGSKREWKVIKLRYNLLLQKKLTIPDDL